MLANHKDIINRIKADEKINFVGFVRTPWHALGCNASLLKLKKQEEQLHGLVVLSADSYQNSKPLLTADNFNALRENDVSFQLVYYCGKDFSSSTIENVKIKLKSLKYLAGHSKGTRKIYVLNPMSVHDIFVTRLKEAVPEADIINIIVDEGLGNYMRSGFNWAVEMYQNTHSIKAFIRSIVNLQKRRLYIQRSLKRNECLNHNILVEDKKHFKENKQITEYYKQVIDAGRVPADTYSIYENAVIISAQLYFENNQIKNDADLEIYKEIVSKLTEKGISVVFKPHPRDKDLSRYDSLDCYVDTDNTVSQEIIIASVAVKPLAVLSFTSTSLVTSKLFYGVKTASLNNFLKKDDVQLTLQNEFSNFEKAFCSVVSLPTTADELIDFIM